MTQVLNAETEGSLFWISKDAAQLATGTAVTVGNSYCSQLFSFFFSPWGTPLNPILISFADRVFRRGALLRRLLRRDIPAVITVSLFGGGKGKRTGAGTGTGACSSSDCVEPKGSNKFELVHVLRACCRGQIGTSGETFCIKNNNVCITSSHKKNQFFPDGQEERGDLFLAVRKNENVAFTHCIIFTDSLSVSA